MLQIRLGWHRRKGFGHKASIATATHATMGTGCVARSEATQRSTTNTSVTSVSRASAITGGWTTVEPTTISKMRRRVGLRGVVGMRRRTVAAFKTVTAAKSEIKSVGTRIAASTQSTERIHARGASSRLSDGEQRVSAVSVSVTAVRLVLKIFLRSKAQTAFETDVIDHHLLEFLRSNQSRLGIIVVDKGISRLMGWINSAEMLLYSDVSQITISAKKAVQNFLADEDIKTMSREGDINLRPTFTIAREAFFGIDEGPMNSVAKRKK